MANHRPAVARDLGDGEWGIWCAYDDREHAKAIPTARWDNGLKCWRVADVFAEDARRLVARLNGPSTGTSSSGASGAKADQASVIRTMLGVVPPELRPATVKALTRVWHPDAGGDHALMVALNQAANR